MDGSSLSLIVIPIVVSISLALWLVIVFYAVSHPLWGPRRAAGTKRVSPARRAGGAAASRTSPASRHRSPRSPAAAGHRG